ncbi:MAG TPA: transposase [Acidimicrobiales bacterium]|nr:transposase [Acidimicrobiales bacterium]
MATMVETRALTGGVDTHSEVHVAAAIDHLGGVRGVESFPVDRGGYAALTNWMTSFGEVGMVGVEGTGSYGAGLARHLARSGLAVVEVDRPNRQERGRAGKSDPLDAIEAAPAAQSGRVFGAAKTRDGDVEAIRCLLVARRSAAGARVAALNQVRELLYTGPEELRERFVDTPSWRVAEGVRAMKVHADVDVVRRAAKTALSTLGRGAMALGAEIDRLDAQIAQLVDRLAPDLVEVPGVGYYTAALLLGGRRRQSPSAPQRGHLGRALRGCPPRRLVGQGRPLSAQPRR